MSPLTSGTSASTTWTSPTSAPTSPASPSSFAKAEDVLDVLLGRESATVELPMPEVTVTRRKLVEIADLDTVLGYKGNYAIYALKENSYLTLRMMQDYLDIGDQVRARDPDGSSGYSVGELRELAACLHASNPRLYSQHREAIRRLLIERIRASKRADELVVVPTSSIYIEALVGTHPLLEDFKLIHRALDVKRVQAEVRHAGAREHPTRGQGPARQGRGSRHRPQGRR